MKRCSIVVITEEIKTTMGQHHIPTGMLPIKITNQKTKNVGENEGKL